MVSLSKNGSPARQIPFSQRQRKALSVESLETRNLLATLQVTTTSDAPDTNPGDGRCETSAFSNRCSLRAAIEEANASPGADVIAFGIPGGGPHVIQPVAALPQITDQVFIDGFSQPGSNENTDNFAIDADIRIELNGLLTSGGTSGLVIQTNNCTVRGLSITGFASDPPAGNPVEFPASGIVIKSGVGQNFIAGNFIGVKPDGFTGDGNGHGIYMFTRFSTVGFGIPAARNLISANNGSGIVIDTPTIRNGSPYEYQTNYNRVFANLIGTTRDGVSPLGNKGDGVTIIDAENNLIGTLDTADTNVIAFNRSGIVVKGTPAQNGSEVRANSNTFHTNSIHSNERLGIDLLAPGTGNDSDGPTLNDPADSDIGGNGLQNHPVLTGVRKSGGNVFVDGHFGTPGVGPVTVEFFKSNVLDDSGFGEGKEFVGRVSFSGGSLDDTNLGLSSNFPLGTYITATATTEDGTSEFSQGVRVGWGITVVDDVLSVFGTGSDDYVRIVTREKNFVAVADFIHPQDPVVIPAEGIRRIFVQTGDGDDRVEIQFQEFVPEDLEILTEAGNDTISIRQEMAFDPLAAASSHVRMNVDSGKGADDVSFLINGNRRTQNARNGQPKLDATYHVQTQEGNDRMSFLTTDAAFAGFKLITDLGSGEDTFNVVHRNAQFNLAAPVRGQATGPAVFHDIRGGAGNDVLKAEWTAWQSTGDVEINMSGGDGDDSMHSSSRDARVCNISTTFDSGRGDDQVITQRIRDAYGRAYQWVDGGDGDNLFEHFERETHVSPKFQCPGFSADPHISESVVEYDGGNGNDIVDILSADSDTDGSVVVDVELGSGGNSLEFEMPNSHAQNLVIDIVGGSGVDKIDLSRIDPTIRRGAFINVQTGAGKDLIAVSITGIGMSGGAFKMNIDAGSGEDVVDAVVRFLPNSSGTFNGYVFGGTGDDYLSFELELGQMTLVDATLDGGLGADSCRSLGPVNVINC